MWAALQTGSTKPGTKWRTLKQMCSINKITFIYIDMEEMDLTRERKFFQI